MRWMKFSIETTTDAEDFVIGLLMDLGINGIEIEDNVPLSEEDERAMYTDIPLQLPPDDGTAKIHFYVKPGSTVFLLEEQEDFGQNQNEKPSEQVWYSTGSSLRDTEVNKNNDIYLYHSLQELTEKIYEGLEQI